MTRTILNSRRSRTGCSILALATVLAVGASPAAAQSFQGSGSFSSGTGVITTSPNTTAISVTSPTAVINWIPTDNVANPNVPIVFQPGGTSADFSGGGNYAVLNRINVADASRVVELHGTIRTVANGALNGTGSLYFYSPSGFLLGGSSVINVPSLVLSALPIMADANGNFIVGADRTVTFGPPGVGGNASASITTMPGSQITANMTGSYVAMVAPRVVHHGTITTNGQAALVAAEAATINFSPDGLFDISVTTGTTDANGIALHGDINGEASTGVGDNNRIYAVAVPKNDILTMVIGSGADLGFEIAGAANVVGNAIVLSAGHNVTDGVVNTLPTSTTSEAAMTINAPRATSAVTAVASGNMHLFANPGEVSTFASNVTLRGDNQVWANASGAGSLLSITGNLTMTSTETGVGEGATGQGGFIALYANPSGTVSVGGNALLESYGFGAASSTTGINGGTGVGGDVWVQSEGASSLTIGGTLTATSSGQGGNVSANGSNGGAGTGGQVLVRTLAANSILSVGGATLAQSLGTGGNVTCGGCTGTGGTGTGGWAQISGSGAGSQINLAAVTLNTAGQGGAGMLGVGGLGQGGRSEVVILNSGPAITINGALDATAHGTGGQSATGGTGRGGTAALSGAGSVTVTGDATMNASGFGGIGVGGTGGEAYGGIGRLLSTGGTVTVGGLARVRTDATAGAGAYGEGGNTHVRASNGGDIIVGTLNATADGRGGNDAGAGAGAGKGGSALIQASGAGSTVTVNANATGGSQQDTETLSADGFGGGTAVGGATAGIGTGGAAEIKSLTGGAIGLPTFPNIRARGYGGTPLANGTTGGLGVGGYIDLRVDGGNLTGGRLQLSAIGQGGQAASSALYDSDGGDATGGERHVNVLNGGILTAALPGGLAGGIGGWGTGTGSGGDGSGGLATLTVDDASFNVTDTTIIAATPSGGDALGTGNGGNATSAGIATVSITNGATVNIASEITLGIYGGGNGGFSPNAVGGMGMGGTANATIANSTVIGGALEVSTASVGGSGGTGGGNTTGGTATLSLSGATVTTEMLRVRATGSGGSSSSGAAGNGTGGTAWIHATGGTNLITSPVEVLAWGLGGDITGGGGMAGDGSGGTASLYAFGDSTFSITGDTTVDASGEGGDGVEGGAGGAGLGNFAEAGAFGNGSLNLTGSLSVLSKGVGGSGFGAAGGDGTGVYAGLFASGGSVSIDGAVNVDASGEGGNGDIGGDGFGGGERLVNLDGAHVYAYNGDITIVGSVSATSSGRGGNGADGGDGGDGEGGFATIHAANSDLGASFITISGGAEDSAGVYTDGTGGHGGDGTNGGSGGNGGAGGNGTAGWSAITAAAGNGNVDVGYAILSSRGQGGAGGDGGFSDGGSGGHGGAGGNATGGGINVGTESGLAEATGDNLGVGSFGSIEADSSATGGRGGDGSDGSPAGNGGAGGTGDAGSSVLLVRGSTVNAGFVQLESIGTGGDGGFGADGGVDGAGGDGIAGEVAILSTARYLLPDQHATLNLDYITGTATGIGGLGSPNGSGIVEGGSGIEIDSSTVKLGTLDFDISGDVVDPGSDPSYIYITNSTVDDVFTIDSEPVDVASSFSFSTVGDLFVQVDNGSLTTDALTLNAGDFVANGDVDPPANRGTIFAGAATVTTGNNFIAEADFDVGGNLSIIAPGLIDAHDFTTDGNLTLWASAGGIGVEELDSGGNIDLRANGSIGFANAEAGGSVYVRATGTLTGNDIDADSFIDLGTTAGISLGDLTAGDYIHLGSNGPIAILTALSGESIDFETQGTLTTGNLTAGDSVLAQAMGAMTINGSISAGVVNPSAAEGAEYRVSLASNANITTQAITAAGEIGFGTPGNLLTGNLDSGGGIMALVGGSIQLPTVGADDYVFLADYSMSELGGEFDGFNRDAVLAAEPVLTGSSITITGPLTAGSFVTAAAGTNLTYASIVAGGNVDLRAGSNISGGGITSTAGNLSVDTGGAISVGALSSGLDIDLDAVGNILFASASAGSDFDFYSDGSVTGGNVVATNEISGHAGGAVGLGHLTAGLPNEDDVSVGISAVGNISVGNVIGAGPVGFATQGNLLTGTINAGDFFLAMVGGNTTTGAITTTGQGGGQVYIADDSMFLTGGGTWDDQGDFDPSVIFAIDPVRTGGAISINGPINTGRFRAAAGTNLTTGAISSGGAIGLDANGSISTGNLVAGNFVLANGGSISTGSIDADSVDMDSTAGNIAIGGDVNANGLVELDAFGNILTDNITAGTINLAAGGSITTDNLTTELPVLGAAQAMPDVDPDGEGNIVLIAGGNILTGNITAAESILLVTPGTITGETIEAGNVFMALAHGDMSFGDATAEEVFLADFAMYSQGGGGGGGQVGAICVGSCGTLGADGVVTASPSGSTYTYVTTAGGPSGAGQLPGEGGTNGSDYTTAAFSASAGDDLEFWFNYVTSDGSGFADYAWASLLTSSLDPVAILFTARTKPEGTIVPGQDLPGVEATLDPSSVPIIGGAPAWSPLGGESGLCYSAGCGYTGWVNSTYEIADAGNYVVRFGVTNWSDGGYASGMAFSGITIGGVPVESNLTPTGGSITIGNVNAAKMTAAAGTTLTTGIIDVSDFANLVSGGNMVTGAITAGNNLWADAGGTMSLGALSAGNIELVSGGNMSFASANAGTGFDFSSDASVNGGNVTAGGHITGEAGGTVAINGTWSAPSVDIVSNDINITQSGSINAGNVQLYSTNATQTVVGDGVSGGGYQLSNAEFNRINANGELEIGAWVGGGAADRMMFGDLTYTDDSEGGSEIEFAVFEDDSEFGTGSMRIVGDMTFNGMSGDDSVQFTTGLFELDAATGSVALYSSGTTLGGELQIQSPHIHVASGEILDQLADDPVYAGYQQDLNKPADVQRPEGVIKAASISLDLTDMGDSATVYVQNTGTTATPAGFLVTDEIFVGEDGELGAPAGSINLVINGQIITEGGTLTGIAVRDEMVAEQGDLTPFTANSTINGCPLTGVCVIKPDEPPPNPDVIDDQIDLITNNPLGDSEFGNEDSIDDNEEGDEGAESPISPPQPLFDTRPLVPTGDVNDPVSGTGNPALVGSETECEESEDGQCPAPASNGEGE